MLSLKPDILKSSLSRGTANKRPTTRVNSSTQNEDKAGAFSSQIQVKGAKEFTLPRSEEARRYFRTVSYSSVTCACIAYLITPDEQEGFADVES
jgi:hypothetical protein